MRRPVQLILAAALVSAGCEPGEVTLVQPNDGSGQETAFAIRVAVGDSTLGASLGWSDGVPGAPAEWAFVHHERYLFHEAVSDSAGVVRFEPEGRGWHWIAAEKEVEIDGERRVLGGGSKAQGSTGLSLSLDHPGTLVISEIFMDQPPQWETGGEAYYGSNFIEVYNNSTEVLYLDSMILGTAYHFPGDASQYGHHSCAFTEPFREDPEALWSRNHWRFPGSGTEYPIAPGQAVVVAVNAADHTAVHPTMLDLADAEFEFGGGGQADNPTATNMKNVSVDYEGQSAFQLPSAFWFLSAPVEVEALQVMTDDDFRSGVGVDYRGIPTAAILDVAVIWPDLTSAYLQFRAPPCEHPVHPQFDALPGGYLYGSVRPEDLLVAPQRRLVRTEDGRAILLDTNTSAVDFENRERTPGWIPSG